MLTTEQYTSHNSKCTVVEKKNFLKQITNNIECFGINKSVYICMSKQKH